MNMTDLKVYLAIIVLREDTLIPASWEENSSEWPWRKISIVPSFCTYDENDGYNFINGLEIEGFNPESLHKNIGEIHCDQISTEVEKIRKEIEERYSGEIQILYR